MTVASNQARNIVKLPLLERAGIGALAGGIAGGFTNATLHPIDTVKTKLQTRGASTVYSGPLDVVAKVCASLRFFSWFLWCQVVTGTSWHHIECSIVSAEIHERFCTLIAKSWSIQWEVMAACAMLDKFCCKLDSSDLIILVLWHEEAVHPCS